MKRQQIHDIHSLADYMITTYILEDGAIDSHAYVEGDKLAKRKDLIDNVIQFALHQAVNLALHRERDRIIHNAEGTTIYNSDPEKGVIIPGLAKRGKISWNESQNEWFRILCSPSLRLRITYNKESKPVGYFTANEIISWADIQIKSGKTVIRRAEALKKLAGKAKDKDAPLWQSVTKAQCSLAEAEYGMQ